MPKRSRLSIKSDGGPIFLGNVDNSGTIRGRTDIYQEGISADQAIKLFDRVINTVNTHLELSTKEKAQLQLEIEELRTELLKKDKANESFILRRLRNIKRMAPDILDVTLAIIKNHALGFGVIVKKIAEKIKSDTL